MLRFKTRWFDQLHLIVETDWAGIYTMVGQRLGFLRSEVEDIVGEVCWTNLQRPYAFL